MSLLNTDKHFSSVTSPLKKSIYSNKFYLYRKKSLDKTNNFICEKAINSTNKDIKILVLEYIDDFYKNKEVDMNNFCNIEDTAIDLYIDKENDTEDLDWEKIEKE